MKSLAKIRINKGKTQEDIAKLLGIGISTYSQYENSQRTIPKAIKEKIADILGIEQEEGVFLPVRFTVSQSNKTGTED